jgi:hypothetical protein
LTDGGRGAEYNVGGEGEMQWGKEECGLADVFMSFMVCILLYVIGRIYNGTAYTTIILKETK